MDRVTGVAYPDTTYEQFVYDRLDLVASRDRIGRWTTNTYNANRQLVQTQDPLGRTNIYGWCHCGAMTSLIDPMGRETTWQYDIQGRVTAKRYVDSSSVTYTYEDTTSRQKSRRDEKGQVTLYEYYSDNSLKRISYPNALISTPTVSYTYDPEYARVLTMLDGIGITVYAYHPIAPGPALGAGRLATVFGPLPNSTVSYKYDELGRVVSRSVNGVALTAAYDSMGRTISVTNALGSFQYSYVNATRRFAFEAYPNGQTNLYAYYDNFGDQRLKQILHLKPEGTPLSRFGYTYNPAGRITCWTNQTDNAPSRFWTFGYDAVDHLTNAILSDGIASSNSYAYVYDPAGNRLQAVVNASTQQFSYNALNQLTTASAGQTNVSYEWDAENRLTAINQGTKRSEFRYDGLDRRVQILEKSNGAVLSGNYFLWCGSDICEMRDTTGATVLRRLFPQGEAIVGSGNTSYFYTKDRLGSIREALDRNGVLATRYEYEPYGQQTVIQENLETTFAFTGDFVHAPSGLYLTWYRPLSSRIGRWLSRDPFGEREGINLYSYVRNNPVNSVDPLGQFTIVEGIVVVGVGAILIYWGNEVLKAWIDQGEAPCPAGFKCIPIWQMGPPTPECAAVSLM